MKPGYGGIESDLFFRTKISMLFGDAKKVLQDLIGGIKNLYKQLRVHHSLFIDLLCGTSGKIITVIRKC
jgi:hypothetical protein